MLVLRHHQSIWISEGGAVLRGTLAAPADRRLAMSAP